MCGRGSAGRAGGRRRRGKRERSMIEIRGLEKRFGRKVVLDGLDLTVPRGKNTVVIGGSGTGKSVLIKCVVGLLRADAGEILIGGGGGGGGTSSACCRRSSRGE